MYKKVLKKYKERTILRNMFLTSFGISLFCILIAFSIGFQWFQSISVDRTTENEENKLSNCMVTINNYISSARDILSILNKNVYIKRLILEEDSHWSDQMFIASNQILNSIAANPRLHSVFLFGSDEILLKSTNNAYPILPLQEEDFIKYFHTTKPRAFNLYEYTDVYGKKQQILSMAAGELSGDGSAYVNGVMVNLDIGAITKEVFPAVVENENYVLLDSSFHIIGSKGENYPFNKSASDDFIMNKIQLNSGETADTLLITGQDKRKYFVNYIYNNTNSYYIIHILPYSYILSPINKTKEIVILSGFVMLVIIFAISFILSLWIYNPIDEMVNKASGINTGVSQEKELKSYKSELSSVTQSITAMIGQLNQYQEKNEQSDIIHYLSSTHTKDPLPGCFLEWFGESTSVISQIICLKISDTENFSSNNTQDAINFQMQTISNLAVQELMSMGEPITAVIDNEYIAIMLFTKEATDSSQELYQKVTQLQSLVNSVLSIKIDAGISNRRQSLEDIRQAYQSAKAATRYSFLYGMNSIITEENMHSYALSGQFQYDFTDIINSVKAGNSEAFTQQYLTIAHLLQGYSLQSAYETLIALAIEMTQYLKNISAYSTGINISGIEAIRKEILNFRYIDEAMTWYLDLFGTIHAAISSMQKRGSADIVNQAIHYLEENYMDMNLSAQLLADKFNITPSYFSRIFNETCKYAFPDYLMSLRMEKAKEILTHESSKSIQEICEAVGYSSSSYFTAMFRKKYGITPSQYRKGQND